MPFSQTAIYALRVMSWMSTQPDNQVSRATQISEATGVPGQYLSKILRRLVVADLLLSQKGRGGGFQFALPKSKIRFIDILNAIDQAPTTNRCAFGLGACDPSHPCPLHDKWKNVTHEVHNWACETTLDQIPVDAHLKKRTD